MKTLIKKSLAGFMLMVFAFSSFGVSGYKAKTAEAAANWDLSGTYVIDMYYDGTDDAIDNGADYPHTVTLVQDELGNLSGSGSSGAYSWTIVPESGGSVEGDTFQFTAQYSATPDALGTVLIVDGIIEEDGSLSGTWSDNYPATEEGAVREGTISSEAGVAEEIAAEEAIVTTNPATAITSSDAMLNGMNGESAGIGHSFWASESPFSTASPVLPAGVYSTPDLGPIAPDTAFSALLSSVSGLPAITPDTTYYFAAWVNVGGTWYPGEVLSFDTLAEGEELPETVKVTIVKYIDGEMATAESAGGDSFAMISSWDAENIGAGSGSYSLASTSYTAVTSDMSSGADYSTSEVMNESVGESCDVDGVEYSLGGYTYGNSLEEAGDMDLSEESPAFIDLTSDKYVIVWNDDCSTPEDAEGEIGGEVIGGEGELAVTSVETLDGSATANNTYEDGWKYRFNITVPTDENGIAMKFDNWDIAGVATDSIPAANNMRISSAQAVNEAPITVLAADTYTIPDLEINEDLDPLLDGLQIQVLVEVKIPAGTTNGSYTTNYGVRSQ
ncbi:MAG: hypothetical protein M3M85_00970 [bacterium]|nr:hypothetical protein [bacterium]